MNQSCQSEVIKMVSTLQRKTQMYLNEQTRHLGLTGSQAPFILITCENGEMIQNKFCELLEMDKSTDNNSPIFGPYRSTAKAIDIDIATWILGNE